MKNGKSGTSSWNFRSHYITALLTSLIIHFAIILLILKFENSIHLTITRDASAIDIEILNKLNSIEIDNGQNENLISEISNVKQESKLNKVIKKHNTISISASDNNENSNEKIIKNHISSSKIDSDPVIYPHSDLGIKVFYPRLSRILKEEGKVVLLLTKNSNTEERIKIIKTSGFQRLDSAATEALNRHSNIESLIKEYLDKNKKIEPTQNKNEIIISFTFKLKSPG